MTQPNLFARHLCETNMAFLIFIFHWQHYISVNVEFSLLLKFHLFSLVTLT